MPSLTISSTQLTCAILTIAVVLVATGRFVPKRIATCIWIILPALAVLNALRIAEYKPNVMHTNLLHYYMGAKYPFSYLGFYEEMTAALAEPQVAYRDLSKPASFIRDDPRERRLYYYDLLARHNVDVPRSASTRTLVEHCRAKGLFQEEAAQILERSVGIERLQDLQEDAEQIKTYWPNPSTIIRDHGFNGSPLYALTRQVDPALHMPLGLRTGYINLAWQIAAAFFLAMIAGRALQWSGRDTMLVSILILASRDFTAWALAGLVFAGWLLPVMLCLWAFHKRRPVLGGIGMAWATLIKLFPLAMIMPFGIRLAKGIWTDLFGDRDRRTSPPWWKRQSGSITALVTFAAALVALTVVSSLTGRSWGEFFQKIAIQFHSYQYVSNGVGLSGVLVAAGVSKSEFFFIPQLTVLFALGWMMWSCPEDAFWNRLPRMILVLLSSMGWLTASWPNYYSAIAFFLVPGLLQTHPRVTIAVLIGFGASYLMNDFSVPYEERYDFLLGFKVLPYLVLPLLALAAELRISRSAQSEEPIGRWINRRGPVLLWVGGILSVLMLSGEAYRARVANYCYEAGQVAYEEGRLEDALSMYQEVIATKPGDARGHFNLGRTYEDLGQPARATQHYVKAIERDDEMFDAHSNLGILYAQRGSQQAAFEHLARAHQIAPHEEDACFNLANAHLHMGQLEPALALLEQAVLINPDMERAREVLERARERRDALDRQ